MAAAWPASLPQDPFVAGFQETAGDRLLRSATDSGKPKRRPRFTAAIEPLKLTFPMTAAQVATLKTFYQTTLAGGSLPFDITHPRTQALVTIYFASEPSWSPEAGGKFWRVALELEVEP